MRLGFHTARDRVLRPKWMWIGALAGFLAALPGPDVGAYRFYGNGNRVLPLAANAPRWDPSIWPPGEVLTWVIADTPLWTAPQTRSGDTLQAVFESVDETVPYVSEALGAWSAIESADIRWEVSGTTTDLVTAVHGDGVPTVFATDNCAYAVTFWEDGGITDCDVAVCAPLAYPDNYNYGIAQFQYILIHELGHCLGLAHAASFPGLRRSNWQRNADQIYPPVSLDLAGVFGPDPIMSYGTRYNDVVVMRDDLVGASLLRPRPGWAADTGRVAGVVTAGNAPASFVPVHVLPISGGAAVGAIGSFTDENGAFVVEGLAPGQYLLWAGSIQLVDPSAHGDLLQQTTLDLTEQAMMTPVTVVRGGTADGVRIALRRNRAN